MKKLIIVPFLLLTVHIFSQTVAGFYDNGQLGRKIVLHGLGTTSTYLLAPNDSTLNFDSSKVVTEIILNNTSDSFYVYKGGVFVRAIRLGTSSGGGTVTGGSITWPGTIYSTPTTATIAGGTLTFAPALANQAAYTVLTNATASSATPSFGRVHVRAINATGSTYDGTKYLSDDGTWKVIASGGGGGSAISALTPAAAKDSIDNADYKQEWQWNSLTGNGLKLVSTSTSANVPIFGYQKLLEANLSGANANANQETHALEVFNTHTGASSTNVALNATASGGTNNYAGIFTGRVGINTLAPTGELEVAGTIVQSINSLAISLKDNSAIRGRAATGGNIYIDANTAIDNTGTINLRGNVAIQGSTTFTGALVMPNITLGANGSMRGASSTNGTYYLDAAQDLTGTINVRATTFNIPNTVAAKYSVSALNSAPASATATGTTGEIRWTSTAVYLCIATNTWVKATLATF